MVGLFTYGSDSFLELEPGAAPAQDILWLGDPRIGRIAFRRER